MGWIYKLYWIGLFGKGELAACLKEREMTIYSTIHYEAIREGRLAFVFMAWWAGGLACYYTGTYHAPQEKRRYGKVFYLDLNGVVLGKKEGRKILLYYTYR